MERPVAQAVIDSGLLDDASIAQLRKWGLISEEEARQPIAALSPKLVVSRIQEAIESPDTVQIRESDLDAVRQFLDKREKGKLHLPHPEDEKKTIPLDVEFCRTKLGEYVIPWRAESIEEWLLDARSYLKPTGKPRVHFGDIRELFFGEQKAFIVCVPRE